MEAGTEIAYIATTVNIATTSYCHAGQRTTMVAINPNTCNGKLASNDCNTLLQPLAMNAIWLQHVPIQPNWAYRNIFSLLRKGQNLVVCLLAVLIDNILPPT